MSREVLSDFHRHYLAAVVTGRQHAALWEHDLRVGAQNARDGTWRIPQAWTPGTRSARSISSGNLEDPGTFDLEDVDSFDHWHRQVDIYLSAGFNSGQGYADQPSCNHVNTDNCGIYRVRWDLDRGEAVEVERVVANGSNYSVSKPSVNPSNTAVAAQVRIKDRGREQVLLRAYDLTNNPRSVVTVSSSYNSDAIESIEGQPHFAHWAQDNYLWFHKEKEQALGDKAILYRASMSYLYPPSDMVNAAQEAQAPVPDTSLDYNDPNVHYDPAVGIFLGHSPPYIVTHGPSTVKGIDVSVPRVHWSGRASEGFWGFDLSIPEERDKLITERGGCAHAAWNITGSTILCSMQEDGSSSAYQKGVQIDGYHQRMIYGFSLVEDISEPYGFIWKYSSNNEHGTLFDPMKPDELRDSFRKTILYVGSFPFSSSVFPTPSQRLTDKQKMLMYILIKMLSGAARMILLLLTYLLHGMILKRLMMTHR